MQPRYKAALLAGMFARTNMGHSFMFERLVNAIAFPPISGWTVSEAVEAFCGDLMESEEHFDIFLEEADGWFDTFDDMSNDDFAKSWPERAQQWDNAMLAAAAEKEARA